MLELQDFGVLAAQMGGIAVLTEVLTQVIKATLKDGKLSINDTATYYVSLLIGILSAIAFNVSLFNTENNVLFYVGVALAGAIAARGANYAYDILNALSAIPTKRK